MVHHAHLSVVSALIAMFGLGCARLEVPPAAEPQGPSTSCGGCDDKAIPTAPEATTTADHASTEARSKTLSFESGVPGEGGSSSRWSVRHIGGGVAGGAIGVRPRRVKHVDVDLVAAPFDEVARLLADTGHFNVVVEAPSASNVTVKLHDVEPYDALVAIAEIRGLPVHYRAGIVIVGGSQARD